LLAVASLGFLAINADRWLAAQTLPRSAFADYAFGWTVLMVAQSVQVVINASLYPMLARRYAAEGKWPTFRIAAKASLGLLLAGTVMAIPLWALLDLAVTHWFPTYAAAQSLLPIFLLVAVLRVSDFWSSYLIVVGQERRLLALNVLSAALGAALWWPLVATTASGFSAHDVALLAAMLAVSAYSISAFEAWRLALTSRAEAP
jgi:O-antigen/teichoic acid export membrane protein